LSLPTTLHQTTNRTQPLEVSTARHLATALNPPSHDHSWRVVTPFDLTKWKSSMKLPEETAKLVVLVLHTLHRATKLLQIYKGINKLWENYRSAV